MKKVRSGNTLKLSIFLAILLVGVLLIFIYPTQQDITVETHTEVGQTILVDIPSIINKSKDIIDNILCEEGVIDNENDLVSYKGGLVEINFVDNISQNITLNINGKYNYSCQNYESFFKELNLPKTYPSFINEYTARWNYVGDIYEVTCSPANSKVFYIYIKSKED